MRFQLCIRQHCLNSVRRFLNTGPHVEEDAVQQLGVVGAGQIGAGLILHSLAVTNKRLLLTDSDPGALKRCQIFIERHLDRRVQEGRMTPEKKATLVSRLAMSTSFHHLSSADFVIEAVTEDEVTKRSVLEKVLSEVSPLVIVATHTACLSVTRLARLTQAPDRIVGMRFMHPVQTMRLVEVIGGLDTPETSIAAAIRVAGALGKTAVRAADMPGFISFRILMPYINEAIYSLQERVSSREEIDTAMKLGTGMSMGPLELADFIGLDVCYTTMKMLQADLNSERYRPCPLLAQYVNAGHTGRKSGRGFYTYDRQ